MKTLSKIIRGVLIYWCVFVATAWVAFFMLGSVPDTLVQYGLGGGAVELIAGALIEVGKKWIEHKYHIGGDSNDNTDVFGDAGGAVDADEPADPGNQDPAQ